VWSGIRFGNFCNVCAADRRIAGAGSCPDRRGGAAAALHRDLLELPDDAAQAAKTGKRLLLYFGQQGCPYCKELMQTSFTQKAIVDKLGKHFVAIGFDLFGNREVTWFDGKVRSEKEFAKFLKVQFTPTLLLLDEKGAIIGRINGYYPPHRFRPRSTTRHSGWKAGSALPST
jgi:thioredoxin-related protein